MNFFLLTVVFLFIYCNRSNERRENLRIFSLQEELTFCKMSTENFFIKVKFFLLPNFFFFVGLQDYRIEEGKRRKSDIAIFHIFVYFFFLFLLCFIYHLLNFIHLCLITFFFFNFFFHLISADTITRMFIL